MRTAPGVLGTCPKIQFQDLSSLLCANKGCSSRPDHRLCLLVLEQRCSSLLEHPSSVVARLGITVAQITIVIAGQRLTPSRCKSPSINGSGPLRSGMRSIDWSRPASAVVDKAVPPKEGRDKVCRLKLVKRNGFALAA